MNTALREIRIYGLLLLASTLLGKMRDDDDEETKKAWFVFLYNMTARLENETSFFFSVQSANTTFLKNFVPVSDTIEQFFIVMDRLKDAALDPETDTYKRGFRKGTSKFWKEFETLFPGTKQHQNVWSFFSEMYKQD